MRALLPLLLLFTAGPCLCQVKVLFDASKAETAGNADWTIDADQHNLGFNNGPAVTGQGNESNPQRYPTPPQAGITAATAGRIVGRLWWPIHKVAAVSLLLVWGHGVMAGSDSAVLLVVYLSTGAGVLLLGVSRYVARTTGDRVADLTAPPVTARSDTEVTRWRRDGVPR